MGGRGRARRNNGRGRTDPKRWEGEENQNEDDPNLQACTCNETSISPGGRGFLNSSMRGSNTLDRILTTPAGLQRGIDLSFVNPPREARHGPAKAFSLDVNRLRRILGSKAMKKLSKRVPSGPFVRASYNTVDSAGTVGRVA
ncbi:MAG TPA: hypothetical protein VMH90_03740 [Thermoplasmata archaeon]|nr:hypothetical protein [Thermoplasmata archaeon]